MFNLLKLLGLKPEKMKFTCMFGHLAATDLTEEEVAGIGKTVEWLVEKRIEPISGYVYENKKGSYFVPANGGMIMKIDCKQPEINTLESDKGSYTLTLGYSGDKK